MLNLFKYLSIAQLSGCMLSLILPVNYSLVGACQSEKESETGTFIIRDRVSTIHENLQSQGIIKIVWKVSEIDLAS